MDMDLMRQILFMEDFKMRKIFMGFLRSMSFLLILGCSLYYINQIMMPKYIIKNSTWPTTSSYNQFYQMDEQSVDVIFLGSSVTVNAFSPQEIYNDYGIRSYNLGSEQQSIFLSYFWLKEALRFQTPKVVVLDTRFLFQLHPENPINTTEGLTRKCLDPMKWSSVKREAVSDLCAIDTEQSELSYYLTNIRFHTRWASLTEHDFMQKEVAYSELKGYSAISEYRSKAYNTYSFSGDTQSNAEMHTIMQAYLNKTVELCKNNNISLILLSLPGNSMNDSINNTLTTYAKENSIDYYNMCETNVYNAIGAKLPKENVVEHENLWGARKMSRYVGKILKETYHVEAVEDEQYETTREFYDHIIKNCELVHIENIEEYLEAIHDSSYTVFLSAYDNTSQALTETAKKRLKDLGLQQDLTGKTRWGYCAVVSPEKGVSEQISNEKAVMLTGSIRDRKTFYTVVSSGYFSGNESSIIIDGQEYGMKQRGINIVVYDNRLMKVVDAVAFDTSSDGYVSREV